MQYNLSQNCDLELLEAIFKTTEITGTHSRQVAENCEGGRPMETDLAAIDPDLMDLEMCFLNVENTQQSDISEVLNEPTNHEIGEHVSDFTAETTEQRNISLNNAFDQQYILSIITGTSATCSKADDINVSDIDVKSPLFSEIDMGSTQDMANLPETVKVLLEQDSFKPNAVLDDCQEEPIIPLAQMPVSGTGQDRQQVIKDPWQESISKESVNSLVKWRLRDNLQQKNGNRPLPAADFTPKPKEELSQEEKSKVETRKQMNRYSAAKSRINQKLREETLKKRVEELEEQQKNLVKEIGILKERRSRTSHILKGHVCKDDQKNRINNKKLAKALEAFLREYNSEG